MLDNGSDGSTPSRPSSMIPLLAVPASIGLDIAAGESFLHALLLGVIAAAVAAFQRRLAGRGRGLVAAAGGLVVVQPASHIGASLGLPAADVGPPALFDIVRTEISASAGHILITALIVAAVAISGCIVLMLAGALRRTIRRDAAPPPRTSANLAVRLSAGPARPLWLWVGRFPRRGPPATFQP